MGAAGDTSCSHPAVILMQQLFTGQLLVAAGWSGSSDASLLAGAAAVLAKGGQLCGQAKRGQALLQVRQQHHRWW
jgi:hypothetical protein